jgi:hypothetical protein
MTDEERNELYRELTQVFRDAGLGWVVDEVTTLVDQGVEKEVSATEWTGTGKPKRGDVRVTRREYSPLERINLLLDAAARVVNDGYSVEVAVHRYFGGQVDDLPEESVPMKVRFLPEPRTDREEAEGFAIASDDDLELRSAAIADLMRQLDTVREQASQ